LKAAFKKVNSICGGNREVEAQRLPGLNLRLGRLNHGWRLVLLVLSLLLEAQAEVEGGLLFNESCGGNW